jgi:hypothetical protein
MIDRVSKRRLPAGGSDHRRGARQPRRHSDRAQGHLQLNPNAGEFIALWVGFALISLLPLAVALVMLTVARDGTLRVLHRARAWLTRNATKIGAVLILVVGAVLIRDGIAGLTG